MGGGLEFVRNRKRGEGAVGGQSPDPLDSSLGDQGRARVTRDTIGSSQGGGRDDGSKRRLSKGARLDVAACGLLPELTGAALHHGMAAEV